MRSRPGYKYRKGTQFRVTFPTVPSLKAIPKEVRLIQEKDNHDILEVMFERTSPRWNELLKTGTPVVFSWNQDNFARNWHGYVNYVSNESAGKETRYMKVMCVGASYLLKQRSSKVWRNKTVTEVAQEIARQFNFEFIGEKSTRRFAQLSMTGQSYWQWLVEHAAKIGYSFVMRNATMYMQPVEKMLNDATSFAPVMRIDDPPIAVNGRVFDRTLDSFTVLKGDYIESDSPSYSTKFTTGVNPVTNKPISSAQSPRRTGRGTRAGSIPPLFSEFSSEIVHSKSFAKDTAQDLALGSRFNFPAKGYGQGDVRIYPLGVVYVQGTGEESDGFWVVTKVQHVFTIDGTYQVEFGVITDGVGRMITSPFRTADPLRASKINIEQKVATGSKKRERVRLVSKLPAFTEGTQGFIRKGDYWSGR